MTETLSDERIKEIKTLHTACKDEFVFFVRYFFKQTYGKKWQQWDHLLEIAEALQQVAEGKVTRLIINVFPRSGKTELAVKMFIPWCLAINPKAKFIHLSYSDDLALDNSEQAKDLVESEAYREMFPHVELKQGSTGKKKWYTTENGGVYATAAGGQVTGWGAGQVDPEESELDEMVAQGEEELFGGAIIIDDPNKPDDADSETLRRRVNERFDSTISNRGNSRKTPIIILQQRTHEDDLTGYLTEKQKGKWRVISMPSIKRDGTALCPHKFTLEELKLLEQTNDIVFQRQHMQNPKPRTGLLFPIDDLKFFNAKRMDKELDDCDFCYVPADPANEGGDDFAAGVFKLLDDRIYITDIIYNTDGTDENESRMIKMVMSSRAKCVGVESVFGWVETAKKIRDEVNRKGFNGEFRNLHPRSKKHTRILNRASFIRNNFVFRDDWKELPQYAKFMRNLTSYKKIQEAGTANKHDDAPDLCEMAGVYYERNFPHVWPASSGGKTS